MSQGTAQVALTTAVVGLIAWLLGLSPAAAFVVGAVFAQSSTIIISKQLAEQGEEQSRHGRLGVAMSVFQDVTAVPFVVVILVLGAAATGAVVGLLGLALLKAVAAFVAVYFAGRWLLRPLFHEVAARRSPEVFTLTVLLVTLLFGAHTSASVVPAASKITSSTVSVNTSGERRAATSWNKGRSSQRPAK